ncbi:hypothetical protein J3F84DRAFT_391694 [Trichoderma pleuroticola]
MLLPSNGCLLKSTSISSNNNSPQHNVLYLHGRAVTCFGAAFVEKLQHRNVPAIFVGDTKQFGPMTVAEKDIGYTALLTSQRKAVCRDC